MKYILGFFVTILLIILLVILLVSGGGKKEPVPTTSKALPTYANSQAVTRLTIDGPINAPQEHQVTRITVSRDTTTLEQIRGYNGEVMDLQTFPNTEASYRSFLSALEIAGFTKGETTEQLKNERGYCPLGKRHIYELEENGKQLVRFWSTTCKSPRTYQGNADLTVRLFKKQIPNFDRLNNNYLRTLRSL